VEDLAGILSPGFEAELTSALVKLEKDTKHQMGVVTTPSLNGQSIEVWSLAYARRIGYGRKGYNDGLMLLVAPKERKVRIEVGTSLEKALTNAEAADILERRVLPAFRQGDLEGGLRRGVQAIVAEVR
jgi:uncharacterized protein